MRGVKPDLRRPIAAAGVRGYTPGAAGDARSIPGNPNYPVPGPPPLLVAFAAPSSIFAEPNRVSDLPIVRNGPPGTFVVFPDGRSVSLPTDQIVYADDTAGHARIGFGGMQFVGTEEGQLVFVRVRELVPEDQLSPDRSHTMRLESVRVAAVLVHGQPVWSRSSALA
jgi:hypothetical protein